MEGSSGYFSATAFHERICGVESHVPADCQLSCSEVFKLMSPSLGSLGGSHCQSFERSNLCRRCVRQVLGRTPPSLLSRHPTLWKMLFVVLGPLAGADFWTRERLSGWWKNVQAVSCCHLQECTPNLPEIPTTWPLRLHPAGHAPHVQRPRPCRECGSARDQEHLGAQDGPHG